MATALFPEVRDVRIRSRCPQAGNGTRRDRRGKEERGREKGRMLFSPLKVNKKSRAQKNMNHAPLLLTPPAHEAAIYRRIERRKNSQRERGRKRQERRFGDKRHNTGSRQQEAQGEDRGEERQTKKEHSEEMRGEERRGEDGRGEEREERRAEERREESANSRAGRL